VIPRDARGGHCPRCLARVAALAAPTDEDEDLIDPAIGESQPKNARDRSRPSDGFYSLGDYELLEELGRGGMGLVYRARQRNLDRLVAVKVLSLGPLADPDQIRRFRGEASAAGCLQHNHIVRIHEVGVHEGRHYIVMDYVEGQSLAEIVRQGPLEAKRAARYLQAIARAIDYAHQRGIIHRDLKPSNILIDTTDQPRITDFGLAKHLDGSQQMTVTGQALGSPSYMAPEQASAERGKLNRLTDVYGLGAVLYHLVTGRPPFVGPTMADTIHQVLNSEPACPRLLNPLVPRDLETMILKCIEKEPARRYASAGEVAEELDRFLKDEPIRAHPIGPMGKAWRWCRRKPALAAMLVLLLVLLLVLGIGSPIAAYRIDQARQTAEQEGRNARRNLYFAQIRLAERALADGNPGHAAQLLEQHIPASDGAEDFRDWEWHYLWNQVRSDAAFELGRHDSLIRSVAISPNGRLAASSDFAGGVSLWNLETRQHLASFKEPAIIHEVLFFSDSVLLTASGNGTIGFYDVGQAKFVRSIDLALPVRAIALSRDRTQMAALCGDQAVPAVTRIWRLSAATPTDPVAGLDLVHTVPSPKGGWWPYTGGALAFSPSGEELAVGDVANLVRIYASASAQLRRTLGTETTQGGITTLDFSPDGRWLASQGTGGQTSEEAVVWNAMTGELVAILPGHGERGVREVAFSTDGMSLLVMSGDQILRQWRTTDWSLRRAFMGHRNPAHALAPSPVGNLIYSGGSDGRLFGWDLSQPSKRIEPIGLKECRALEFSPSGDRLATVEPVVDQPTVFRVGLRSTRDLRSRLELPALGDDVVDVAFSPDGQLLAALNLDDIGLWDIRTKELEWTWKLPISDPRVIVGFSIQGDRLLLIDREFTVSVLDTVSGQIRNSWSARGTHPMASRFDKRIISFHPESHTLVLGHVGVASVWDVDSQRCRGDLSGHSIWRVESAMSWDGRVIVTLGEDGDRQVRLWNAKTLELVGTLDTPPHPIYTAAFSPNGRRIAIGLYRFGAAGIYDVATGIQLIALPPLGTGIAQRIAWSPDGTTLAIQGPESIIWQLPSAESEGR
jgi:eukaryotic-like serine/threonine-protein kinase